MKCYEQTCTRIGETSDTIKAWAKGEGEVGIKDSLFICENGRVEQYVESSEGKKFNDFVKNLSEEKFNNICDEFFVAIRNKDLVRMHKALAVFDEMDNYEFGTDSMKRRLLRIRSVTESKSYEIEAKGSKNFIIYKGKEYLPK